MKTKLLFLLPLVLLTACSGAGSSSESSATSEESFSEPSSESSEMHREKLVYPIRQFCYWEGERMQHLFGDGVIPESYFEERLRLKDLLPGDVVTWEFETYGIFYLAVLPYKYSPIGYDLVSITKKQGSMVELEVVDGVPQWEKAGVVPADFASRSHYEDDEHVFEFAENEEGIAVSLNGLDKVYAGVSADDPTLVVSLSTYPFRS